MKVRGIQVGTQRYIAIDQDVYDWLSDGPFIFGHDTVHGNFSVAWLQNLNTRKKQYVHDYILQLKGLVQGRDYEYVKFLESFPSLRRDEDYSHKEILWPPIGQMAMLDLRIDNLHLVTKKETNPAEVERKSKYKGVVWDQKKKKWRAFLNGTESGTGNTVYVRDTVSETIAARCRDIACIEKGKMVGLNFDKNIYHIDEGFHYDIDAVRAIKCRTNKTPLGYEAAVFDNPNKPKPRLVFEKFYSSKEEARNVCVKYVLGRFGKLSEAYFEERKPITTQDLKSKCEKCGCFMEIGVFFLIATRKGTLKVCEQCFDSSDKNKSDMPDPDKLMSPPSDLDSNFTTCKKCGTMWPALSEYFPTYIYKGQLRLKRTCKSCVSEREKKRYRNRIGEDNE